MKFPLCKIDKNRFDELKNKIITEFEQTGTLHLSEDVVAQYSIPLTIDGKMVEADIDIEAYDLIISEETYGYTKSAKIGMQLHKELKSTEVSIPGNIFYEKEFWAYLSLTIFKDVVKGLRSSLEEGKANADKISRFYFNSGKINRTCLLFIWAMIDLLNSAESFEISHTAFEFIDPVKAVFDCTMGRNPAILRAFVQGIINNNKDAKFKSDKYRSKVPANISCYASVNVIDSLEYDELVEVITEQQKEIIG